MMRTLIVADCNSLPLFRRGVLLENTYIGHLSGFMQQLSGGGWPIDEFSKRVYNVLAYYQDKAFDLGIIGIGLADCCPRPAPNEIRHFVDRLPGTLRMFAISFLRKYRAELIKIKLNQYTPINEFTLYYNQILRDVERLCKLVVVVQIAPVLDEQERLSPGLRKQIAIYNAEIFKMARFYHDVKVINLDAMSDDKYLVDDHVSYEGHKYIWEKMRLVLDAEDSGIHPS